MKIEGIGAAAKPAKEWAFSYSKLKNYEVCPRKHYEVDLAKTYGETQSDDPDSALNWGNRVHDTFAKVLKNEITMPAEMAAYQHWIDRVRAGPGSLLVEQKYAITRDFQKTSWFANNAWCRMIGDVVKIADPFTSTVTGKKYRLGLVLDWKTGKIVEEPVQLMLMAQALFSHFPDLTHVRSEYVWLKDDCTTPEVFTRQEVADKWLKLLPRVQALETAAKTQNYPPKPGYLCKKYCPVESCPYWRKGSIK